MASLTVENYVKAIFKICLVENRQQATTGQLAAALDVSPGTVTSMLKNLSENGLAAYTPYEGVRLTDRGRELALRMLRRHRLIELFLVQSLGLNWGEVHEDAEQMEHVISDRLLERIDEYLRHPEFDPHGDPIPTAEGVVRTRHLEPLSECPPGCHFSLGRVIDQSPDFLRFLSGAGLALGAEGEVVGHQPEAGTVSLRLDAQETTLSREAASKLLVSVSAASH